MQSLGLIRIRREYKNRTAFRLRWAYTEKNLATPVAVRKATKFIYNAILAVQPLK